MSVGEFMIVGERASSAAELEPGAASIALAKPKSRTLAFPSLEAFTFWGLRSRWTIPFSWASSSACAICSAKERLSVRERGPDSRRSARVGPGTSSMTRARTPPASSSPKIEAMFGWWSCARSCASRSKRARRSLSSVNAADSTLIATSRLRRLSVAR